MCSDPTVLTVLRAAEFDLLTAHKKDLDEGGGEGIAATATVEGNVVAGPRSATAAGKEGDIDGERTEQEDNAGTRLP